MRSKRQDWTNWDDEKLLKMKLSRLNLQLGGMVQECIAQLQYELEQKSLAFRPHFWLSDEWYTPDGIPGIAVPFYLAHPRLAKLEASQMLEVEGGTPATCLKILRHEAGHAIENAFQLRRRKKRQQVFGKSSVPYPDFYSPRPYSKSYVLHIDSWYAQSHPDEDFAETFAVWLDPSSDWQRRYAGWPALKKLMYMDELMSELKGKAQRIQNKEVSDPIETLDYSLKEHYEEKRERFGINYPGFYDRDLRRLFRPAGSSARDMTAAKFLRKIRKEVRRQVATWTGEYQYTIDSVIQDIIDRTEELDLWLAKNPDQAKTDFTLLLTVQTMNFLHSGRHRVAL